MRRADDPTVSVVVPARNEADYIGDCLDSIIAVDTDHTYEILVVDGDSRDGTATIARDHGVQVVPGRGTGIGAGRHRGARVASGDWLAFVDADTTVDPDWLDELLGFAREHDLVAASSRCRMPGVRASFVRGTINRVFPHLSRPVLPGFNFFVDTETYAEAGGFPNVPNEDTAFSRRLSAHGDVAYHPDALVETSPRRVAESGLTGTLYHYVKLDVGRLRSWYGSGENEDVSATRS
ncbi:glycosyltransferase [Haloarchaeobius iranensis]|uniref:Glycosyl transferase family 2 n=1 Tax=Haloarchaeobius iranensis TaxID=996166 RepID=A0A1G9X1S2_9EURY|nr:glycosyltransferase [Haloarchaeobius iranensis]SDM90373.1 Glycosyl transferase family 2 [Haloarchaeobius iranensis]